MERRTGKCHNTDESDFFLFEPPIGVVGKDLRREKLFAVTKDGFDLDELKRFVFI